MSRNAIFICIDKCLVPRCGGSNAGYFKALHRLSQFSLTGNCGATPMIKLISHRDSNFLDVAYRMIGEPNGLCLAEGGLIVYEPQKLVTNILPFITSAQEAILKHSVAKRIAKFLQTSASLIPCFGMRLGYELLRKPGASLGTTELRKNLGNAMADLLLKKQICLTETEDSIGISLPKIRGQAISYLERQENYDLGNSIVIATSKRDIGFLSKAKFVGCPENSEPACKRFVRCKRGKVSQFSCAQGVVDIIEHFTS